jgi:hydroxycarboxylate dehydrogenase B
VKASPPANPEEEVLVAGEPELMKRKERSEKGVPIERATWDEMLLAAQKLQLRPAEIEALAR